MNLPALICGSIHKIVAAHTIPCYAFIGGALWRLRLRVPAPRKPFTAQQRFSPRRSFVKNDTTNRRRWNRAPSSRARPHIAAMENPRHEHETDNARNANNEPNAEPKNVAERVQGILENLGRAGAQILPRHGRHADRA